MGRPSKPWRRKGRDGWWAKINGEAVRLADTERQAWVELSRLLGRPSTVRVTVADLVDLWLSFTKRTVKPVTWSNYQIYGQSFVERWGKLLVADIREHHVDEWLDGQPGWIGCRPLATTVVRMCWRWGRRKGHLAVNELAEMRGKGIKARDAATPGAVEALADGFVSEEFADLYRFMVAVGCRPGEARTLRADRIDLDGRIAIVEGKKGLRPVVLPDVVVEPLRRAMARHPQGFVFRSSTGEPWGMSGLSSQVRRARRRLGVGEGVVAYHARGHFASKAHAAGVDAAVIAAHLGHTDISRLAILIKNYLKIDPDLLRDAVERANAPPCGGPAEPPPPPGTTPRRPPRRKPSP